MICKYDGCTGLNSIEIPNSVEWIGTSAFEGCTGLTSIEIPNSVERIGASAFSGCHFKILEIPDNTTIYSDSLGGCLDLENINTKNSLYYVSIDGVLYSKNKKSLVKIPCGRKGEYIPAPETMHISTGAFRCSQLHIVTLSSKISEIGEKAFYYASLHELHIHQEHPEEITIANDAFEGLENCTLYVPIGTGYAYRHHPAFEGKFKEVKIERTNE